MRVQVFKKARSAGPSLIGLQAVARHLKCVVETEFKSSGRPLCAFNCGVIAPAPREILEMAEKGDLCHVATLGRGMERCDPSSGS